MQYSYDALGRVVEALNATTNQATEYGYDSAGNILAVKTVATSALTIAGFSTTQAPAGAQVTIYGTGFSSTAGNNTVKFNGVSATVVSATSTQLVVTVPTGATTGIVTVTTSSGGTTASTRSATIFVTIDYTIPFDVPVVPSGAANTKFTVTAGTASAAPTISGFAPTIGPAGTTVTINGANFASAANDDKVLFNQTAAVVNSAATNSLQVAVPSYATSGPISVVTPQGVAVSSALFYIVPSGYNTAAVAATGTLAQGSGSTSITLTASNIALECFNGTGGQYLTIGITNDTIANAIIKVYAPNGSLLTSGTVTPSTGGLQIPKLPATGAYTILVDPGANSGTMTLALITPITASLTAGGSALSLNLNPVGQRALVTFSGTAGQYLTFSTSGNSIGTVGISVTTSNGAVLASGSVTTAAPAVQIPRLPTSGAYTVLVDPANGSGSISLTLTAAVTANIPINTNVLVNVAPPNRVVVMFSGSPGQYLAFTTQEGQNGGVGGISGIQTTVYAPDGTNLNGSALMFPPNPSPTYTFSCNLQVAGCAGNSIINLGPLPAYSQGTTFTAVITPSGGSGPLSFYVTTPFASPDGPVVNGAGVTKDIIYPGQGITLPVSLTAGQQLSITLSEQNGNLPAIHGTILDPNGTVVANYIPMYATCTSPCNIGGYSGNSGAFTFGADVSGTWTILLQQMTQSSGPNDYGPLSGANVTVQITSP